MKDRPEFSMEVTGEYSLLNGDQVALLDESGRVREIDPVPSPPTEGSKVKYRAGKFWAQSGTSTIVEFMPKDRTWYPRLLMKAPCKDFEVTFDGRILLIGTPEHLVEFYQPMSAQPEWVLGYPSLDGLPEKRDASKDPYFFWSFPVCGRIEDALLIYFPNLGRIYRTNILKPEWKELDVPWSKLSIASAAKEVVRKGFIAVTGRPPCNGIEFIPETASRVRVLFATTNAEFEMRPPAKGEVRAKLVESKPSTERGIHWFTLELDSGRVSTVQDEPDLELPLGLDPQGSLVPISSLFQRGDADARKPELKPAGSPAGLR